MSEQTPLPPQPEGEEKKKGFLSRSIEKGQQARADHAATKAEAAAEAQAVREAERARFADAGHQFMEYRVVYLRETLIGDKINTVELDKTLNQWAEQGWHLKALTTAQVAGRVGAGGVSGVIVTFERPRLHGG